MLDGCGAQASTVVVNIVFPSPLYVLHQIFPVLFHLINFVITKLRYFDHTTK
jgi:hypothetical protein